jgi:hypothetical protein
MSNDWNAVNLSKDHFGLKSNDLFLGLESNEYFCGILFSFGYV